MTFIITLYVNEGIVMAADSRLTLSRSFQSDDKNAPAVELDVLQSDANFKIFLCPNDVGISTCGDAGIQGVPLAGYIEQFIEEKIANQPSSPVDDEDGYSIEVDQVAAQLLDYFKQLPGPPDTDFHVCGYKNDPATGKRLPYVYRVSVAAGQSVLMNSPGTVGDQGVLWGGEGDVMFRLIQQVYAKRTVDDKDDYQALPSPDIAFQYFTLQDAIDFAVFAVRTTADTIRFIATRAKTVGGPIDVLVIKPSGAQWVARKQLHVSQ